MAVLHGVALGLLLCFMKGKFATLPPYLNYSLNAHNPILQHYTTLVHKWLDSSAITLLLLLSLINGQFPMLLPYL